MNRTNALHTLAWLLIAIGLVGQVLASSKPTDPLEQAAQEGNVELTKTLLVQKQSQYLRDSALRVAIRAGHRDVMELLIAHGARYALVIAAEEGDAELVKHLLTKGPDANLRDSALHAAARLGRKEAVELLLSKGADVNAQRWGDFTPLFVVATAGCDLDTLHRFTNFPLSPWTAQSTERRRFPANPEIFRDIVELLIHHGADVSIREKQHGFVPLHYAVFGGSKEVVAALLDRGAPANPVLPSGNQPSRYLSPLHLAAHYGDLAICELLVARGADVNSKLPIAGGLWIYNTRRTPLHHAADSGNAKIVELLADHGAEVDATDSEDETPLYVAAEHGDRAIVEILLSRRANVNAADSTGRTPLHHAAQRKDRAIVEALLSHGADADRKSRDGRTPTSIATRNGSEEIVKLLTARHKRVTIHSAASMGDIKALERLLKDRIEVNRLDVQGQTALHAAATAGQLPSVRWLVEHGAKIDLADDKGTTALSMAMRTAYEAHVNLYRRSDATTAEKRYKAIMAFLISRGATLDFSYGIPQKVVRANGANLADLVIEAGTNFEPYCDAKATLMHRAAWWGRKKAVEDLINLGADLNATDTLGGTPLHAATQSGCTRYWDVIRGPHVDVLKLLIAHGANVNTANNGKVTPLHGAAGYGNTEAMEVLLAKGAKVDAIDDSNTTPLHRAAAAGSIEAVKLLLSKGADANVKDSDGNTVLLLLLSSYSSTRDEAKGATRDFVLMLIKQAVRIDVQNHEGVTPLQQAAALGLPDLLEELLTRGTPVNQESTTGWTALHSAVTDGNTECVAMLLKHGARIDVMGRLPDMIRLPRFHWPTRTPLHIAASRGNNDIVELLIAAGANVNAADGAGKTPLYLAHEQDHPSTAKLLLDSGARNKVATEEQP